jgi:hypothetical protein
MAHPSGKSKPEVLRLGFDRRKVLAEAGYGEAGIEVLAESGTLLDDRKSVC